MIFSSLVRSVRYLMICGAVSIFFDLFFPVPDNVKHEIVFIISFIVLIIITSINSFCYCFDNVATKHFVCGVLIPGIMYGIISIIGYFFFSYQICAYYMLPLRAFEIFGFRSIYSIFSALSVLLFFTFVFGIWGMKRGRFLEYIDFLDDLEDPLAEINRRENAKKIKKKAKNKKTECIT